MARHRPSEVIQFPQSHKVVDVEQVGLGGVCADNADHGVIGHRDWEGRHRLRPVMSEDIDRAVDPVARLAAAS
jgi:hypothetical protein